MFIPLRVALCVVGLSLFSATAECHTRLVSSTPENGQVLTQAPDHIIVRFSSPIEKKLSQLQLSVDNGKSWLTLNNNQSVKTSLTGKTLKQKNGEQKTGQDRSITADLPVLQPARYPASYQVRWRVLSKDGHMQRGEFSFELRLADQMD